MTDVPSIMNKRQLTAEQTVIGQLYEFIVNELDPHPMSIVAYLAGDRPVMDAAVGALRAAGVSDREDSDDEEDDDDEDDDDG